MKDCVIGCDVGGSHITCGVVHLASKTIASPALVQRSLDSGATAERILGEWAAVLGEGLAGVDPERLAGIGFAMPGPFDYAKGVAWFSSQVGKYLNLNGVNISERLRLLLGLAPGIPIRYMNDAAAFAVGEAWAGGASRFARSVCVTLGTGFGSAFIQKGVPVVEGCHVPRLGCLWHLPCRNGIANDFFSTRWLVKAYLERTGNSIEGVRELAARGAGEPAAAAVFQEFGVNLGNFLAPWLVEFGAESLVVGGNIAQAYPYFGVALEETLAAQAYKGQIITSILMERAALLGSARLLDEAFWTRMAPLLSRM